VHYLDFLAEVHDLLKPRTYLEIGVRGGDSLALSSASSIGIDPAYEIAEGIALGSEVMLYRQTSDDFFAADQPLARFPVPVIDLAFIDGMHLSEYALRDFANVERHIAPGGVIVFDDMLPRVGIHATRERKTRTWTGDVWKIIPTLRELRPDLILLLVRTSPTGLLLVLEGDPHSTELSAAYDRLHEEYINSGAKPPTEFIERTTAVYPTWVAAAPFWAVLREQRERGIGPAEGRSELLAVLQEWTSTTLNDTQAKAIHPSLTGKPKPRRTPKAALEPAHLDRVPSRELAAELARRVRPAVARRVRKLRDKAHS
jgi:hypothetical protein